MEIKEKYFEKNYGKRTFVYKSTETSEIRKDGRPLLIIDKQLMGEEVTDTEFPYCKLMTDEDLPQLTLNEFNTLILLIHTEKYTDENLDKRIKIYKRILDLYFIPETEYKKRIEIAEEYLRMWTNGWKKQMELIPEEAKIHIKEEASTILVSN
ncbi:MAG: hypothetical protein WC356_05630 [Candidatus Micrarchaeia archaeon]|jgi:hypothetical protein